MRFKKRIGLGPCVVVVTDNWEEFLRMCKKYANTILDDDVSDIAGRQLGSFVWVKDYTNTPVLVHELIHAVDNWMHSVGIQDDTEVRAYAVSDLLSYLLPKIPRKSRAR